MPVCMLYTNLKRLDFEENSTKLIAKCVSELLDYPIEVVFVMIHAELPSYMGGSKDAAVVCQLRSMNRFIGEKTLEEYYSHMFNILEETTKIPRNRIVIELIPVNDGMVKMGE